MSAAGQHMNCNDYKAAIAADPSETFDGGAAHASACESCSACREELRALDERIVLALSIDVPELRMPALPPIDAASNVVNLRSGWKARMITPVWMGIAASFALAIVFGPRFLPDDKELLSLADEVIAHLDHEPQSLRIVSTPVATPVLNAVVKPDIADVGGVGLITYAHTCIINGKKVPHLVIQGATGPITVLLMPDEPVDDVTPLRGKGIKGVIIPINKGSIAIIGDRNEQLDEYEQRVVESVRWRT